MPDVKKQLNNIAPKLSYADALPEVTDVRSLRAYGDIVNSNVDWMNEFMDVYNKIAFMVITNKVWENPLKFLFKKYDYGIGIEEVFTNIAKPLAHDPYGDGGEVWKRIMPDVRNYLHIENIAFDVQQTVYEVGLQQAFYSFDSMNMWFTSVITAINNGVSKTLYECVKYLMAVSAVDGGSVTLFLDETKPKDTVKKLKTISDKMTFMSQNYNRAAVDNFTAKSDLYLFVTPEFNAEMSVDVYAYMFNTEYGDVKLQTIMVDNFYTFDYDIIGEAFKGGVPHVFTTDEINFLKKMPFVLCDKDYLFLYNFKYRYSSVYNQLKTYWNYITQWWGSLTVSPFANAVFGNYGTPGSATGIINPYESENITVGRDNRFKALNTRVKGLGVDAPIITPTVTGNALIPDPMHPGWYKAALEKGLTATLTYSYSTKGLVVNVTTV